MKVADPARDAPTRRVEVAAGKAGRTDEATRQSTSEMSTDGAAATRSKTVVPAVGRTVV